MADGFDQASLDLALKLQMNEVAALQGMDGEVDDDFMLALKLSHEMTDDTPFQGVYGDIDEDYKLAIELSLPFTPIPGAESATTAPDTPTPRAKPAATAVTNSNSGDTGTKQSGTATCTSCYSEIPRSNVIQFACSHDYCTDCIEGMVRVSMTGGHFPPACCTHPLTLDSCERFLPPDLSQQFRDKQKEHDAPTKMYCHDPKCAAFIPEDSVQGKTATCQKCDQKTCVDCKDPSHEGECPEHPGRDKVLKLGRESGWRACAKCGNMVERSDGCNHMTCLCRYEFCYACGKTWERECNCTDETGMVYPENHDAFGPLNNVFPRDVEPWQQDWEEQWQQGPEAQFENRQQGIQQGQFDDAEFRRMQHGNRQPNHVIERRQQPLEPDAVEFMRNNPQLVNGWSARQRQALHDPNFLREQVQRRNRIDRQMAEQSFERGRM